MKNFPMLNKYFSSPYPFFIVKGKKCNESAVFIFVIEAWFPFKILIVFIEPAKVETATATCP